MKARPKTKVKRVINNSPPRSLRLANRSLLPPLIILSPSSAPPCNNTTAINNIEIMINATITLIPPN